MRFIVENVGDSVLADMKFPPEAQATLTLVTNDSLCSLAVQAYNAALRPADSALAVSRILLVKVGTTRYNAVFPGRRVEHVLDESFNRIASAM